MRDSDQSFRLELEKALHERIELVKPVREHATAHVHALTANSNMAVVF